MSASSRRRIARAFAALVLAALVLTACSRGGVTPPRLEPRVSEPASRGGSSRAPASAVPAGGGSGASTPPALSPELASAIDDALAAAPQRAIARVSLGVRNACAVDRDGNVLCWGENQHGRSVPGAAELVASPARVLVPERVADVSTGGSRTCALGVGGAVYCWGLAGYDAARRSPILVGPTRVARLPPARALSVAASHICAVARGGRVYCWGNNFWGQLGLGSERDQLEIERPLLAREGAAPEAALKPEAVPGVGGARDVSASGSATCALLESGSLACWGQGFDCRGPVLLPELGGDLERVAGREGALCTVARSGIAREVPPLDTRREREPPCHGYDFEPRLEQRLVGAEQVACVDALGCTDCLGCAVRRDGDLVCWPGRDALEADIRASLAVARQVHGVREVAVGRGVICVITKLERLACWGRNHAAQLGRGDRSTSGTEAGEPGLVPTEPAWPAP